MGKDSQKKRKFHPENIGGIDDPEDIWYAELGADGSWQPAPYRVGL